MTITLTIDPAVEAVGIQTIAVALKLTNVTNEEARLALANHLKGVVANLYVQGDKLKRDADAAAAATTAAATKITVA